MYKAIEGIWRAMEYLTPRKVIVGMASGVDLWAGQVAIFQGHPLIAAKPWSGHKPHRDDSYAYDYVCSHAEKIVDVSPIKYYPGPWIYQKRNEWMVDHADVVLAVWDGSPGGTMNCIDYASEKGLPIYHLQPNSLEADWI